MAKKKIVERPLNRTEQAIRDREQRTREAANPKAAEAPEPAKDEA